MMAKWAMGLACSIVASLISLVVLWLVATQWDQFSDKWLALPALAPIFCFFIGFVPVAKATGEWPLDNLGQRFLISGILAAQCAVLGFLAFLVVSLIWNERTLPLEKASIIYLLGHPDEVSPLKQIRKEAGKEAIESDITWHRQVFVGFFVGGLFGFMFAARKNDTR
jgi:hypothetical protein